MSQTRVLELVPFKFDGVYHSIASSNCSGQIIVNIDEANFTEEQKEELVGILFKFYVTVGSGSSLNYIPIDNASYIWNSQADQSLLIEQLPDACYMTVQAITASTSSTTITNFNVSVWFDDSGIGGGSGGGSSTSISAEAGNSIVSKSDGIYGSSNVYPNIKQIEDFLYEIQFTTENIDQSYCYDYFVNSQDTINFGGCTGFYLNGNVIRHYDWYYDNTVEFLVRRAPDPVSSKYGSIGIASAIPFFTKELVGTNKYYEKYKLIPFSMCDGINEKGMYIQQNVTPRKKVGTTPSSIHVTHTSATSKGNITCNMIGRIVLDNCATVAEAKTELAKYDIYRTAGLSEEYDLHFLLGDASNNHCILEFSADGTQLTYINNCGDNIEGSTVAYHAEIMTNFSCDSAGITTGTFALDYDTISGEDVSSAGLERWEICKEIIGRLIENPSYSVSLDGLRRDLMYTNMYGESYTWYTEFCGDTVTIGEEEITLSPAYAKSNPEFFAEPMQQAKTDFANRVRGDGKTWQTVHSAIYNLHSKTVNIVIQERSIDEHEYTDRTFLLNEVSRDYSTKFPDDMWDPTKFTTTASFCKYLLDNYYDLATPGTVFSGSGIHIGDLPSSDTGGELILTVVNDNFYKLEFFSDNTVPHRWFTFYEGGIYQDYITYGTIARSSATGWMSDADELKLISGYDGTKNQILKHDNTGTIQWVDGSVVRQDSDGLYVEV